MVKIIFVDVDGTLFDTYSKLSKTNKLACIKAQKLGVPVVVNTGRYGSNAIKVAKMLNVEDYNGYVIGNDGAEIWSFKEKKWIYLKQIPSNLIIELSNWLIEYDSDFIINFNCINTLYINKMYKQWTEWLRHLEIKVIEFHSLKDIGEQVSKIIVILEHYWDSSKINNFISSFEKKFPDLTIVQYHTNVFSIGYKNNSKGSAINWLCNLLNIKIENVMAIGDSFNDLAMLELVGYPVVMDNAHEAIKAYAKWIAPNNDNSGVAHAIKKFVINSSNN